MNKGEVDLQQEEAWSDVGGAAPGEQTLTLISLVYYLGKLIARLFPQ